MTTGPVLLSELGGDPASVLRLIGQFDALEERDVDAAAAVRTAAVIAGCPVGANHLVFEIDRLAVDDDLVMTEGWMNMIYPGAAVQAIDAYQTSPVGQKRTAARTHA